MTIEFFLRGIIIGIIFGVPAGALGALVIQRTLEHGFRAGLLTGLGSSIADTIYASLCVLGSKLVNGALKTYNAPITIVGGIVILTLGMITIRKKGMRVDDTTKNDLADLGSGFGIAIMNPGMILLFLFACSMTKTRGPYTLSIAMPLLIGAFLGTFIWWLVLCTIMTVLRKRITDRIYTTLNKILGTILIAFGCGVIIDAIRSFF